MRQISEAQQGLSLSIGQYRIFADMIFYMQDGRIDLLYRGMNGQHVDALLPDEDVLKGLEIVILKHADPSEYSYMTTRYFKAYGKTWVDKTMNVGHATIITSETSDE